MRYRRALLLDGWNTAVDGRMTLTAFSAEMPSVREEVQEVPAMDGVLDLSEEILGRPAFARRTLTATLETSFGTRRERIALVSELISRVHGRQVEIVAPDTPGKHYLGRVSISGVAHHAGYSELTLNASCDPYLYANTATTVVLPAIEPTVGGLAGGEAYTWAVVSGDDIITVATNDTGQLSFTVAGNPGDMAVVELTAQPNLTFYIAMQRTAGRGIRRVAAVNEEDAFEDALTVHTGDEGKIYLRFEQYSSEPMAFSALRVIAASAMRTVDVGAAPVIAEAKATGGILLAVDGRYYNIWQTEIALPLRAGTVALLPISEKGFADSVEITFRESEW